MQLLKAKNISLQIAEHLICQQLNLDILAGDVWGILGPNGCGKTTLLHALAGLVPTKTGEIFLQDCVVTSLTPKFIARHLGILLQDTEIFFPQTVFEFCLSGRYPHLDFFSWETEEDKRIALSALTVMELHKKYLQNCATLSGGERRRLAIAALLTQTPMIYLLDEPTNHLDLRQQIKVLTHFKTLAIKNNAGVMMALHDVNLAAHYCNKILMLFGNGEFLTGTPDLVLNSTNLSRLYRHPVQNVPNLWSPTFASPLLLAGEG